MGPITDAERQRIAELVAEGAGLEIESGDWPVAAYDPACGHQIAPAAEKGAGPLAAAAVAGRAGRDFPRPGGGGVHAEADQAGPVPAAARGRRGQAGTTLVTAADRGLAQGYPDDPDMRVSHETIYLSLFVQARGALRKELFRCLRTGRPAAAPGAPPPRTARAASATP